MWQICIRALQIRNHDWVLSSVDANKNGSRSTARPQGASMILLSHACIRYEHLIIHNICMLININLKRHDKFIKTEKDWLHIQAPKNSSLEAPNPHTWSSISYNQTQNYGFVHTWSSLPEDSLTNRLKQLPPPDGTKKGQSVKLQSSAQQHRPRASMCFWQLVMRPQRVASFVLAGGSIESFVVAVQTWHGTGVSIMLNGFIPASPQCPKW